MNEIEKLKESIEYEEMQYNTACQHPTNTAQFSKALERSRQKISEMKQKLADLTKES